MLAAASSSMRWAVWVALGKWASVETQCFAAGTRHPTFPDQMHQQSSGRVEASNPAAMHSIVVVDSGDGPHDG